MLWKYFQSCMSCFRESWEINLTTWHTVPRFNQWLFIVSVGLKVLLQFVPWHGFPLLLNKECEIRLIPSQRSSSWFANFLYLFAIYSVKTKKKNSVLHTFFYFLHLLVLKYLFRVFLNAILSKCYRLLKISKRWTEKRRNLSILSNSILLAWRSILENNST